MVLGVGQASVCIATVLFVYFQYVESSKNNTSLPILLGIFWLFAGITLTDKIGSIFSGAFIDEEQKEQKEILERQGCLYSQISSMMHGTNHIVTFTSAKDGNEYCIAACKLAVHIRNTVIRYGESTISSADNDEMYLAWLKAKEDSLSASGCTWKEIVSIYLDENDRQIKLMKRYNGRGSLARSYSARFIDDKTENIVQMTVFNYKNGEKEVVFGWEFPGIEHAPSFLSG